MNKNDLKEAIAANSDITKAAAGRVIDSIIGAITSTQSQGKPVTVAGFGTFTINDRKARTGRNPITGEALEIPPYRITKFTPAKAFKAAVNRN